MAAEWIEDDGGIFEENQGSFAPEILPDGNVVYSRRFVRNNGDGTFTVVTYEASATKDQARYGFLNSDDIRNTPPFQVSDCMITTLCTDPNDPGWSEIDTDYHWGDTEWDYDSIEAANAAAKRLVTEFSADYIGG